MRTLIRVVAVSLVAVLATGCASDAYLAKLDAKFDAGWRPSKGYCAWGGETEKINDYCLELDFGTEGRLASINARVLEKMPPRTPCTGHAKIVKTLIEQRPDLKSDYIYSCPFGWNDGQDCHVSVLVTDRQGERWVVDNKSVVHDQLGIDGVAKLADFTPAAGDKVWVGRAPTGLQLLFGDFADLDRPVPPDILAGI